MKVRKKGKYIKYRGITVSLGNRKLASSLLVFNIPAVKTCPNCSMCKDTCYARKSEKMYPSVLPCRERNYQASKELNFSEHMGEIIQTARRKYGLKAVRIHSSGDFYSQEYADSWTVIASMFPSIKFFTYSKSPYRPKGDNINIVESILPDGEINYGNKEYILEKAKKYRAPICPYGMGKAGKQVKCGETCHACITRGLVLFLKH